MILTGFCFHFDILVHIFVGQEKKKKTFSSRVPSSGDCFMVLFLLRLPPLFVFCILFGFCRKVKNSQTNVVGLMMQVLISNK